VGKLAGLIDQLENYANIGESEIRHHGDVVFGYRELQL
jgi:hypothetical protein